MPAAGQFAIYALAALALNLTPGPDMLYVAARSAGQGRAAGLVSALGISAGCLFHVVAAALGLTALLRSVPQAFTLIRWAGAAYLIWMGVRALSADADAQKVQTLAAASLPRVFLQGLLTNVLNPKVALFFLAFVPQFIDPARGAPTLQFLALGLWFDVSGTLILLAIALLITRLKTAVENPMWKKRLRTVMGVTFIGLGARLAISR